MGLPSINITFSQAAQQVASLSAKGTVAVMVRDTKSTGGKVLTSAKQIPSDLGAANQSYIKNTFIGNVNRPKKVLLYVISEDGTIADALSWLSTQVFDWLAAPPDVTAEECATIKKWIDERRAEDAICKAVLPNYEGDSCAIVNFCGDGLASGTATYSAGDYCSRIAGLIAGTPYTQACTYAALPELTDCTRMTPSAGDSAVDAGKLITIYDGVKVKLARGVTSLVTTTPDIGADYKKIKFVELLDRIQFELKQKSADNWIGKYTNSYDNQCIVISAITSYFQGLHAEGLIQPGFSVEYDVDAKREWLEANGVDISNMDDDAVKQCDSGSYVFIIVKCKLLDAIEDVIIRVIL